MLSCKEQTPRPQRGEGETIRATNGGILMLTYHLMTEQEKELASSWRYKGEYAIYNEPSYQEQKE